jgi:hypothetical protein
MIRFDNVSLDVLINAKRRTVLRECSFAFDDPRMIVIAPEPPIRSSVIG